MDALSGATLSRDALRAVLAELNPTIELERDFTTVFSLGADDLSLELLVPLLVLARDLDELGEGEGDVELGGA